MQCLWEYLVWLRCSYGNPVNANPTTHNGRSFCRHLPYPRVFGSLGAILLWHVHEIYSFLFFFFCVSSYETFSLHSGWFLVGFFSCCISFRLFIISTFSLCFFLFRLSFFSFLYYYFFVFVFFCGPTFSLYSISVWLTLCFHFRCTGVSPKPEYGAERLL